MTELQMSPEVRALLGPEGLARAAEVSLVDGTCAYCRTRLQGTVNMVVRTSSTFVHVVYVHAACGPSEVVPLPADHQPPAPADGYDMTMTAAVLDHGGINLPVLVAETVAKAYAFDGPSGPGPIPELTSLVTSSLLGDGFTLISRITQEPPPEIPEWIGVLLLGHGPAGEDGLLVLDPEAGKFYTGGIELPASWLPAVAHYGWAVLYVGDVGLAELHGDDKDTVEALRAAAQAGRLVGARIAIGVPPLDAAV